MDNRDYSVQPLTVDEFDRRAQAHQHELEKLKVTEVEMTKRAKVNRSAGRMEALQTFIIGFFIVSVLFGIGIWIWSATNDPEPGGLSRDERREIACVENGGGWVPNDMLSTRGDGLCVYPGKSVPVPAK